MAEFPLPTPKRSVDRSLSALPLNRIGDCLGNPLGGFALGATGSLANTQPTLYPVLADKGVEDLVPHEVGAAQVL